MVDFKSFDSAEDMMEWVAQRKVEVQSRSLAPAQEQIKYGDYAVRFMENVVVFVYVEPVTGEPAEVLTEYARKDTDENMLFCKCFSELVPDGEYGWLHRSVLWPIRQVVFDMAGSVGWKQTMWEESVLIDINDAWFGLRASRRY